MRGGKRPLAVLLAVFAFDPEHHAPPAHLARLREPRLCGEPVRSIREEEAPPVRLKTDPPPQSHPPTDLCVTARPMSLRGV